MDEDMNMDGDIWMVQMVCKGSTIIFVCPIRFFHSPITRTFHFPCSSLSLFSHKLVLVFPHSFALFVFTRFLSLFISLRLFSLARVHSLL